jgi:hypothetical protein
MLSKLSVNVVEFYYLSSASASPSDHCFASSSLIAQTSGGWATAVVLVPQLCSVLFGIAVCMFH